MSLDMNPEIRAQWCAALRSGDYQQATEALRAEDDSGKVIGYCCLGVLTDLAAKAGIWDWEKDDLEEDLLPPQVAAWAGLGQSDPVLRAGDRWVCASALNDDEEWPFAQIADAIDGGAS